MRESSEAHPAGVEPATFGSVDRRRLLASPLSGLELRQTPNHRGAHSGADPAGCRFGACFSSGFGPYCGCLGAVTGGHPGGGPGAGRYGSNSALVIPGDTFPKVRGRGHHFLPHTVRSGHAGTFSREPPNCHPLLSRCSLTQGSVLLTATPQRSHNCVSFFAKHTFVQPKGSGIRTTGLPRHTGFPSAASPSLRPTESLVPNKSSHQIASDSNPANPHVAAPIRAMMAVDPKLRPDVRLRELTSANTVNPIPKTAPTSAPSNAHRPRPGRARE